MTFIDNIRRFWPVIGVLAIAGCEPTTPKPAPKEPEGCKSEQFEKLLWQPASVLETMKFGSNVRIIRPGMAVTMDFRPSRLNIKIGESNRIERVYCG